MTKRYAYLGDEAIGSYVHEQLGQCGYSQVAAPAEADVVFVYCFHSGAIEDYYFDDEGLIKVATPQTLLVDLSPSTVALARELSAIAMVNDIRSVEAPLCLSDPLADEVLSKENLFCYLGGDATECDEAREHMGALCSNVVITGDCASAQLAKAMHTNRQVSRIIASIEELALYSACKEARFADLAGQLPAFLHDDILEQVERSRAAKRYGDGAPCAFLMADVLAAMATSDDAGIILPQLEASQHILELFGLIGGADLGVAALVLLYGDEEAGADAGLDWARAAEIYAQYEQGAFEGSDEDEGYDDFDLGDGIDYHSN